MREKNSSRKPHDLSHRLKISSIEAQEKVSDQTEYFAEPSLFDKRKDAKPLWRKFERAWASNELSLCEVRKAVPFSRCAH